MSNFIKMLIPVLILLTPVLFIDISVSISDIVSPPLCYNTSCIDGNPRHSKCDADVQTHLKEKVQNVTLQMRYSARCDASWASAIVPPYSILYLQDIKGNRYGEYTVEDDGISAPHFSGMAPGKSLSVCVKLPQTNNSICTKNK